MPVTRIKNNQITDLTVNAASKLQDFSITSTKIANNLTYGSDFTIAGNLTVQGNVTAIDTVDLVVEDPLILLAKDQTGIPSLDIGFIGRRGDEDNIAFVWDESADRFVAVFTTSEITNTVITINSYASMQVLDLDAANLTITGNTVLGNLSLSGNVSVDMGNSIISNVAEPVANSDVATKAYVDSTSSAGFTIEDDVANTTVVSGGDTLLLLGTADEITVLVTDVDEVTFGLPANVTIANNLTVTDSANVGSLTSLGNISGDDVSGNTGTFTGNVSSDTFLGNIEGVTGTFTGNVSADTFLGNIDGDTGTFTGNVSADTFLGNIDGVTGMFSGDVSAANVDATTAVNANQIVGTNVTIISSGTLDLQPSGDITVSGALIRDVGDPLSAQDAATKQYVDDAVSSGIHIHAPVLVETPVALPAATYAQGGNVLTVNETVAGNTVVFTTAANLQVNDQLWFDNSFNGVVGNLAYFVVSTPNTSAAVLSTTYSGEPVSNIANATGLTESVRVNSGIGATLTANVNGGLIVDGVSVTNGDRVLVYQQALGYENGVYDVTDAGNVSAPWILTRSSDADTYEPQTSTGLDQGSYFYVQSGDTGAGESYVKTEPPGPFIIGLANIVFTQFSASQVYSANTQAGINLSGTVFSAKVDLDTTAFDNGGNISVKAGANLVTPNIGDATGNSLTLSGNGLISVTTVSATGNISGGNITTAGTVSATGNVSGGNITTAGSVSGSTGTFTGNVTVDTVLGNIAGTAGVFTGNVSGDTFLGNIDGDTGTFSGNVTVDTLLGNIDGATGTFSGNVTANQFVGNITAAGSNTQVQFNNDNLLEASANFTFDQATGQVIISGSLTVDNVVVDGDSITSLGSELVINEAGADVNFRVEGDTQTNLFIVDAGSDTVLIGTATPTANAALKIGTTNSILVPVGSTAQRPDTAVTGMVRFNTSIDALEFYDSIKWVSAGEQQATVITADSFTGDGSTIQFTLSEDSTTAATMVSINGVVQEPTVAYAVTGNVLTFTEAPESTDVIDARIIQTTVSTSVLGITNAPGNASITGNSTQAAFDIIGNLLPAANVTYDLGSPTAYWNNAYFSGNTIFLGPLQLKAVSSTEFGVFTGDGTTAADLDVGNIDVAAINQGNTVIGIAGLGGNAYVTVDGTANVLVVSTAGADITGAVSATGNVSGNFILGNGSQLTGIDATSIQNGTSNVRVASSDGNVVTGIGGTDNIVVISSAGANITGILGVTGNVSAGNVLSTNITGTIATASQPNITSVGTLASLDVTGNVTAGNITGTNITGTIATATQPMITSVGTLGNLSVTGNISAGNLSVSGIESVGTLTINNDATIIGNLTVQGNTITANVTSLVVSDPIINLGRGANNTPLTSNDGLDRGVEMFYYTTEEQIAFMGYDNNEGKMIVASNVSVSNNVITVNEFGTTQVGVLEAAAATVTGNVSAGNVSGTNITGTLATASQPNITGLGTLGSLTVTGNVSAGNLVLTTALPVSSGGTGITAFGTGVANALGQNVTGTGSIALSTSPSLTTPNLGTPTAGNLSNCTADGTNAVGFKNIPTIADKTSAYVIQIADVGKVVGVGDGGSIEIPNSTFASGDAVLIFNNTSSPITITCTITTAYIAGTDEDKDSVTLAARGICNILFISGTMCILNGNLS